MIGVKRMDKTWTDEFYRRMHFEKSCGLPDMAEKNRRKTHMLDVLWS